MAAHSPGGNLYAETTGEATSPGFSAAVAYNRDGLDRQVGAIAASASAEAAELRETVGHLLTIAGLAPGDVSDATLAALLANGSTSARGVLDGRYATVEGMQAKIDRLTSSSPEAFGAAGDGVADDTAALQSALADSFAKSRSVILQGGSTYRITGPISFSGQTVQIVSDGAPAVIQMDGQEFSPFTFSGSDVAASSTLTGITAAGTNRWTLESTADVIPGMLMEVRSSKPWYYDPRTSTSDARKGELHLVHRVEGNTVFTRDVANDGYNTNAETVAVSFFHPVRVHLENLTIKGTPSSTNTVGRTGVTINRGAFPTLRTVSVEGCSYTGIYIAGSYRPTISGGHVLDANGTLTGYGVQFFGCRNSHVQGVFFSGCRRGVDVSGGGIPSVATLVESCTAIGSGLRADGVPYGWDAAGNEAAYCAGFGSHGPADHTSYRGNTTINLHDPYPLRGGNEIIENARHMGRTGLAVVRLWFGEHLTIRGMKVEALATAQDRRESATPSGTANINALRPTALVWVSPDYCYDTARVQITDVDAELGDKAFHFRTAAVLRGDVFIDSCRFEMATVSGADPVTVFHHDGTGTLPTGSQWEIGTIRYRRRGGTGSVQFTTRVNLAGARMSSTTTSPITT